jgi:hypothetical protein
MAFAVLLGLPGIGVALIAKPLKLGEGTLLLGILLSLALPVLWFLFTGSPPVEGDPSKGTGGRS